jgi:glyoxylase-like metal-dependent hydrolase (beta-lactamase superfamily II)
MARAPQAANRPAFDPQTGAPVEVAPGIVRVTAPNPSPFTFTGTNSYLIGIDRLLVIDPGPNDRRHLEALLKAIAGRPVEAILVTHTHRDHSSLARLLKKRTGAPLRFSHPHRLFRRATWLERRWLARACDFAIEPDAPITDGEVIEADGMSLVALATPGHCENHLCFGVRGTDLLFSGDHVMGWSSTVVAPPDGAMGPYLASLGKAIAAPFSRYLPGHGDVIAEGRKTARALLAHRQSRNAEILDGLDHGADTPKKLVDRMYQGISPKLRPAALATLQAHLDYLVESGAIARKPGQGRHFARVTGIPAKPE